MKKVLLTVLFLAMGAIAYAQTVTPVWEKSAAQGTKPVWFDTGHLTRGLDYGVIGGAERVLVVSRNGGSFIYVLDAATGDSLGKLSNGSLVTGGTYAVSDVSISEEGVIYVCNLAVGGTFKVYKYASLADTALVALTFDATGKRLGDKFTVTGKASDNTLTIWAASASTAEFIKFTTADNGATFTPTVVPLTAGLTGGSSSLAPYENGIYLNATGINPKKLDLTGALVGSVPGTVVSTGSNAIRYITSFAGDEYVISFSFGAGNENARIFRADYSLADSAHSYAITPTLGANGNANGAGDVSVKKNADGTFTVFVLSCNNGLGAYKVKMTLAGNYYIPKTEPLTKGFATFSDAITALNSYGTSAPARFLINDNLSVTAPSLITRSDLTDSTGLTIKPAPTKMPTVTFSGCVATAGATQYAGLSYNGANYITIDGSNTVDGTTKDLTFAMNDATNGRIVIQLYANGDNNVIKNLNIAYLTPMSTATTTRGIYINGQAAGVVDNFTVQNCSIGDATNTPYYAISVTGYGTAPTYCSNITIKGSELFGRIRPVYLYVVGAPSTVSEISDNRIYTYGGANASTTYTIFFNNWGGTVNVFGNKIPTQKTNNASGTSGVYGISGLAATTGAVCNLYNNFIGGDLAFTGAAVPSVISLLYIQDNGTYNVMHNTFNFNAITNNSRRPIINISGATANVTLKNNIIIQQADAPNAFAIYKSNGALESNYNDIFVTGANANVGYIGTDTAKTLAIWKVKSYQDSNSVSKAVNFVSETDLHVTGTSNGDVDLAAVAINWITTDIDGEGRVNPFVYMGADEGSIVIPVELTSFVAYTTNDGIKLDWSTATETNNKGFEVQRSIDNVNFESISFVNGNGTTAEKHSYSFTDNTIANGKVYYRLKQIDYNGAYSYSNVIEADFTMPLVFSLSQNYPNPFNPTTVINFTIPTAAKVMVRIYDILGREVAILANSDFAAGRHNLDFNASNLSSGTYFYTINAEGFDGNKFQAVKKMMLIK